jgi:Domain of unknown function (DUF4187)/G-patch domain
MAPSTAPVSNLPKASSQPSTEGAEQEDDDYLTMTFADPVSTTKESLTQTTKRKQRLAELCAHPKSKSQLAADGAAKRDAALSKSTLDPSSKGFRMMAKLGYKAGDALGKANTNNTNGASGRLLEPVAVEMKEGRQGIGADAEKKRKFREEVEARVEGEKRVRVDEGEFRERVRLDREERRREGLLSGAQGVAERLAEEEEELDAGGEGDELGKGDSESRVKKRPRKPLSQINVLWRGAVKRRELAERDKQIRYDVHQSLSRLPKYDDPEEDKDDGIAFGKKDAEETDLALDQEDEELDDFDKLGSAEKLQMVVQYLRERWYYCFWCKHRYEDSKMEGCPGTTEDDHD